MRTFGISYDSILVWEEAVVGQIMMFWAIA